MLHPARKAGVGPVELIVEGETPVLTEMSIEGYKPFRKKQTFRLAPITLVYGPNSGGKSSLMEAIQILLTKRSPSQQIPGLTAVGDISNIFFNNAGPLFMKQEGLDGDWVGMHNPGEVATVELSGLLCLHRGVDSTPYDDSDHDGSYSVDRVHRRIEQTVDGKLWIDRQPREIEKLKRKHLDESSQPEPDENEICMKHGGVDYDIIPRVPNNGCWELESGKCYRLKAMNPELIKRFLIGDCEYEKLDAARKQYLDRVIPEFEEVLEFLRYDAENHYP